MKRFTATEKWDKSWFQDLPLADKCLWQYLCDNCDAAGVWDANWRLASFQIGAAFTAESLAAFGGRVEVLDSGKVWLVGFCEFQYGQLSRECRAQNHVFRCLEKHGLLQKVSNIINTLSDTLSNRVSNTLQDKEEDKDKDKDTEKDNLRKQKDNESDAEDESLFAEFWDQYPAKVGKKSAKVAFRAAGCAKMLPRILASLETFKQSPGWLKDGGQYIPHPTTWIHGRRWEDESIDPRATPPGKMIPMRHYIP